MSIRIVIYLFVNKSDNTKTVRNHLHHTTLSSMADIAKASDTTIVLKTNYDDPTEAF